MRVIFYFYFFQAFHDKQGSNASSKQVLMESESERKEWVYIVDASNKMTSIKATEDG